MLPSPPLIATLVLLDISDAIAAIEDARDGFVLTGGGNIDFTLRLGDTANSEVSAIGLAREVSVPVDDDNVEESDLIETVVTALTDAGFAAGVDRANRHRHPLSRARRQSRQKAAKVGSTMAIARSLPIHSTFGF